MIDYKDLRVGNWLRFNNHTYVQVFEINSDNNTCNGLDLSNDDFHEPIPLTPELLIKCGFEGMVRKNDYILDGFRITHVHLTENFCYALGNGCNPPTMKYLHQLQNLYYVLTGKELEIDLK